MAKQLTILFWGFIYGEVIGYVLSALSGSPFEPLQSGLIAMVGGFIAVNCLVVASVFCYSITVLLKTKFSSFRSISTLLWGNISPEMISRANGVSTWLVMNR